MMAPKLGAERRARCPIVATPVSRHAAGRRPWPISAGVCLAPSQDGGLHDGLGSASSGDCGLAPGGRDVDEARRKVVDLGPVEVTHEKHESCRSRRSPAAIGLVGGVGMVALVREARGPRSMREFTRADSVAVRGRRRRSIASPWPRASSSGRAFPSRLNGPFDIGAVESAGVWTGTLRGRFGPSCRIVRFAGGGLGLQRDRPAGYPAFISRSDSVAKGTFGARRRTLKVANPRGLTSRFRR